jgi:periplasmic protein TonB
MKIMKTIVLSIFLLVIGFSVNAQTATPKKVIPICEHYAGGQDSMYSFINKKVLYPPVAKRNRIQGECIISLRLKEDGRIDNVTVVKNIGGGCGEEAARVVRLLKFRAPGFQNQYTIPIIFKL